MYAIYTYVNKDTRKNDKIKWGSHFYVRMSVAKRGIRNKNGWTKINKSAKFWASQIIHAIECKVTIFFKLQMQPLRIQIRFTFFSLHFSSNRQNLSSKKSFKTASFSALFWNIFKHVLFFHCKTHEFPKKISLVCYYHFIQSNKRLEKLSDF